MKKTISINISGVVFNIEEDAYEDLKRYLDTISGYFTDSDGREEIMADIEARIAELFHSRLNDSKNVVGSHDVQEVIDTMGRPEDYLGEDEQGRTSASSGARSARKRLYRDQEKNLIGGVCSGLSYYLGWDPIWLRVIWGLSVATVGVGILPYIILWIIIPAAKTTSEKLEMMGEPINVESIKKKVNETVSAIREAGTSGLDTDFQASYAKHQVQRGGDLFVDLLKRLVRFIGRLLGFFFFVGGMILAAFLLYSYFDGTWLQSSMSGMGMSFSDLNEVLFTGALNTYTFIIGLGLVTVLPLVAFILLGVWLLFSIKSRSRVLAPAMIGLWIIGVVMLLVSGLSLWKEFVVERFSTEYHDIAGQTGILYLDVDKDVHFSDSFRFNSGSHFSDLMKIKGDSVICGYPVLDIVQGLEENVELKIERIGHGFTPDAALDRSEAIVYNFEMERDTLRMAPFFSFRKSEKFRGQDVDMTLKVPRGKRIYIGEGFARILDDVSAGFDVDPHDLIGREWIMTKDGLMEESKMIEVPMSDLDP